MAWVELNELDTEPFSVVSELWPFIRSAILTQLNLLGRDMSQWLPLAIAPEEIMPEKR